MKRHSVCLNCGDTVGAHQPDDPASCGVWHPDTCTTCPEHKEIAA